MSGARDDGGPAFPVDKLTTRVDLAGYPRTSIKRAGGMSLLDHFAGLAMQVCLAKIDQFPDEHWRTGIAKDAYMMADAMIKERSK